MKKYKKLKMAMGGKALKISTPEEILFQIKKNSEEASIGAMNDPTVKALNGFGSFLLNAGTNIASKGIAKGGDDVNSFGQFMGKNLEGGTDALMQLTNLFAYGGNVPGVPVEIEGKEVGETPMGEMFEAQGPSHEAGGIDTLLPPGTEMFSKRIKVDGVSMADRKKNRKKKEVMLEDMISDNLYDAILTNSLDRTKTVNKKEEEADKKIQDFVGMMINSDKNMHAFGQTVNPLDINPVGFSNDKLGELFTQLFGKKPVTPIELKSKTPNSLIAKEANSISPGGFSDDSIGKTFESIFNTDPNSLATTAPIVSESKNPSFFDNLLQGVENLDFDLPNVSLGDAVGLFGNLYSMNEPMNNTLKQREGDTPNINAFKDFGEEGLQTLDDTKKYVDVLKNKALADLELSKATMSKRNRNSARGINTLRALDMATNAQTNNVQEDIYNNFTQQMMQILSQQAGMENQRDQIVMSGEQAKDLADRQDRDNFFSQLAQDISTKGTGLQVLGKNLNQLKSNKENLAIIEQLKDLGFNDNQIKSYIEMIQKSRGVVPQSKTKKKK